MDGVLAEGEYLRKYVADTYYTTMDEVRGRSGNGYEVFTFDIPGIGPEDVTHTVNKCIHDVSCSAEPTPYTRAMMEYVHWYTGRPITVVTARICENMETTYNWFNLNMPKDIPFNLIMVNGMQKHVVLNRIGNRMFVDDRYKTIKTLEDYIDYPILYNRPWNQGRPEQAGFATIENLYGLQSLLPLIKEGTNA
jgi:hypothetical protein